LSASGVVAADTRKMSFRCSQLFGTVFDEVDAVITPEADKDRQSRRVSNFKNINRQNSFNIRQNDPFLKFETLNLGKKERSICLMII